METKQNYEAPRAEVMILSCEGMICNSNQVMRSGYGEADEL